LTNSQAQGYAVLALKNLIKRGIVKADTTKACCALDREMYDIMDMVDEEEAEEKATRILRGMVK
jgi:hypothetical protein